MGEPRTGCGAQAVTIKNSTIETTTRISGVINQIVTGSGNTADMNFGADIRGANVENSRISSTVRINGVVSNVVTGSGNTSTINFGLKAGS